MTKVCAYCHPKHIIGHDDGSNVYTHGLCTKAYIKESVKMFFRYELPAFFEWIVPPRLEDKALVLVGVYVLSVVGVWASKGFAVTGF